MARIVETTVYQYAELDDKAKARARDWYRESMSDDSFWHESVIEDAQTALERCGFHIGTARHSKSPAIYFSGFWSQGDGACFEASWMPGLIMPREQFIAEYPATWKDSEGKEHESKSNAELQRIHAESLRLASLDPQNEVAWHCTHTGRYSHERSVEFAYDDEREVHCDACDMTGNYCDCQCDTCGTHPADIQEEHEENARDAMRWVYRQLEDAWEWQNSDEVVAENIEANEYEFTKEGDRA